MSDQCGKPTCGASKTERICPEGFRYVKQMMEQPPKIAVMACEGACIKGEVARVAANMLAYKMHRDKAVRICLGDAVTGNSGFAELIQRAPEVIAIEGCPLQCGTEILKSRLPDVNPTVVIASSLYEYDKAKYFEIFDLPHSTIEEFATQVANEASKLIASNDKPQDCAPGGCCSQGCC